jgi:sterol desaturase/sphingolipid hydroxylase (fatty acid hydroxylase superfamily)
MREDGTIEYSSVWWAFALPRVILPLHLSIAAVLVGLGVRRQEGYLPWLGIPLGLTIWSLFEYFLHRILLHDRKTPIVRKVFWEALHKEHHLLRTMRDPQHRGIHPVISVPIVLAVVLPIGYATTSGLPIATAGGWVLGYCGYEFCHWSFHAGDPDGLLGRLPPLRALRRAHEIHHLERPGMNYGFLTLLWDRVFRTYDRVGRRIPSREAPPPSLADRASARAG